MTKITESTIETFAIELLEKQGYQYVYGPSIAPDSDTPERASLVFCGQPRRGINLASLGVCEKGKSGFFWHDCL